MDGIPDIARVASSRHDTSSTEAERYENARKSKFTGIMGEMDIWQVNGEYLQISYFHLELKIIIYLLSKDPFLRYCILLGEELNLVL